MRKLQSKLRDRTSNDGPLQFLPMSTEHGDGAAGEPLSAQQVAEDALAAIDTMSRKLRDLARELNCLGFFDDDDDDRPRAA